MGKPFLDTSQVGRILAYAAIFGDVKAGKKFDITPRTIRSYRQRMNDTSDQYSEDISQEFLTHYDKLSKDWASEINPAILKGIKFLETAFNSLDPTDVKNLVAVQDAIRTLAEIGMAKELINERLNQFYLENGKENMQVASPQSYIIEHSNEAE